jgi:transcriptional regulator with PAS, ATPase and Fis domain
MMRLSTIRALDRVGDESPFVLDSGPVMTQLQAEIASAARCDAKVLIVGETGAGKDVVARLIHQTSLRYTHPFVAINCAALPDTLLESELFGHVRGSFTGAYQDKTGLAVLADRGTLFLDEIGEMSPRMQAVLLRFTETCEIHRVGSDRVQGRVNTRIISATNRNLPERIAAGEFRQDLYYRLNVICITVPPLRERASEILPLFNHFLTHYARAHQAEVPALTAGASELLLAHSWPGNVRELKNVAERMVVRRQHGAITSDALPREIRYAGGASPQIGGASPVQHEVKSNAADAAWNEMTVRGKSFWAVVHPLFIDRELTKTDLRHLIKRGLEHTQGSYRKLLDLFHMAPGDYKRFLAFLYQHDCHLAFHSFRESREKRQPRTQRPA